MEEKIRNSIKEVLLKLGVQDPQVLLERPTDRAHGDYSTNAAFLYGSMGWIHSSNPREFARKVVEDLGHVEGVGKIEVAGPGFINITLSPEAVRFVIAEADAKGSEWGRNSNTDDSTRATGIRVMIEYGNPNAFKEMHIGHAMGTIIGESLSRLIENEGAKVARDTFGGDVGPNVAKALWAVQKAGGEIANAQALGAAYAKGSMAYEESEEAKAEIDALNQAIYKGKDGALVALWQRGREISMQEFRRIWAKLGTKYDFELFDSDTTENGLRLVRDGLTKGIFKESDGAIIYDGEGKGVHTMVFITSHQTPTYEAKDIGLAFLREERWPSDRVIIVTGNEQTGRFKTVLSALAELAPALAAKTTHIAHGSLRLTSGKMSSREGNVITAAGLIAEVIERAKEKNEDPLIAEQVAIGAIKYMILRQAPGSDIIFDPVKSLSLEGDSGPYLQYALVRAKSVLLKAEGSTATGGAPDEPYVLERALLHFPQVVARASRELSPNTLTTYLTELAGAWNAFYAKEQIIGDQYEAYKLVVARAFVNTMTNGLTLLGIPIAQKM